MSEVLVAGIRILFLALLWIFILFIVNVIRTDQAEVYDPNASETVPRRKRRRRKAAADAPTMIAVTSGRSQGLRAPLAGQVTIGRSYDCTLTIDDDYASEKHAQLAMDDQDQWLLSDLLSTNGSYVNEVAITEPTVVTVADTIRIGRTQIRLET